MLLFCLQLAAPYVFVYFCARWLSSCKKHFNVRCTRYYILLCPYIDVDFYTHQLKHSYIAVHILTSCHSVLWRRFGNRKGIWHIKIPLHQSRSFPRWIWDYPVLSWCGNKVLNTTRGLAVWGIYRAPQLVESLVRSRYMTIDICSLKL